VPNLDNSTPLTRHLRAEIASHGPISFREFMAAALYDPEHGYYASGRATIGRRGDFITSVSVGRLFGTLLARQFVEMWERMARPASFALIEQGAHDGTLMDDVLRALQSLAPASFEAARPLIIEPGKVWREKQMTRLKDWPVEWVESVDELDPFTGIHYSNELLDAFPVHLVRRVDGIWAEVRVDCQEDRFVLVDRPMKNVELGERLARIDAADGYLTEVCLEATQWMRTLGQKLACGYVLAIDYGFARAEYYRADRSEGTLEAVAAHRREKDPVSRPGEMDLTAHVDFTSLAEAARREGLRIEGFTDQHHFMVGLAARHFPDGVRPSASEMRAFQTLAHPTMLGRSFRVFAAARGIDGQEPLAGFAHAQPAEIELGLAEAVAPVKGKICTQ
jgi:SAM-dependent MidA family methyltransferase